MFWFIRKIFSLAFILAILFFSKDFIAKFAFEKGIEASTGLNARLSKASVGIQDSKLGLEGLSLISPEGFSNETMVVANEIFVDYDLRSAFKGKLRFQEVRLDLDSVTVVRNSEGKFNIASLDLKGDRASDDDTGHSAGSKKTKKDVPFQVDHLLLRVGKVIYKDYTRGKPLVKEYQLDIYEKFEDIRNPDEILGLVLKRSVMKTALANVANFDTDPLKEAVTSDTAKSFRERVRNIKEKLSTNSQ